MKVELDERLVSKYLSIFPRYGGDPRDTCLAFGIECGDGWFDLLDKLCGVIKHEVEFMNRIWPQLKFRCEAEQVKEKYGILRFYIHFYYEPNLPSEDMERVNASMARIGGAITMAEAMSSKICETCGEKSTLSNDIFPKNECNACATLRHDALSNRDLT